MHKKTQPYGAPLGTGLIFGLMAVLAGAPVAFADLGAAGGVADAGAELQYFKYEEPDIMEETGGLFGIFGRYTYRTKQNEPFSTFSEFIAANPVNTFALNGRIAWGSMDYTSNGTGSVDNINDMVAEVSGTAGMDFPMSEFLLTPYLGLGFRYWSDELGGKTSTTGHAGYDRESHYLYLPIGFNLSTNLDNGIGVDFNMEFDIFLDGTQKSHLEDVSPALSTLENDQNDGWGLRGAVTLTKQVDNLVFLVEPFVRYWSIDDSTIGVVTCGGTPCALGYEPKNNSLEAGARVGVRF